jgi:hypothetical protein
LHIGNLGDVFGSSCVCTDMTDGENAAADIGGTSTNPGRWTVFGKAMAIVLLWQLIPTADVAVGMVAVARESPATCGVDRCGVERVDPRDPPRRDGSLACPEHDPRRHPQRNATSRLIAAQRPRRRVHRCYTRDGDSSPHGAWPDHMGECVVETLSG